MKKHIINPLVYTTALLLLIAACGDNAINGPIVNVSSPLAEDTFETGQTIVLDFELIDESDLQSYKIELHGAHDGHTHKGINGLPAFDTIIVNNDLSGTAFSDSLFINIPDSIWPGPYHLRVFGADVDGNESIENILFVIINPIDTLSPSIVINLPAANDTISGQINLDATVDDKLSNYITEGEIVKIKVELYSNTNPQDIIVLGEYFADNNFDGKYNSSTDAFVDNFSSASLTQGAYTILVSAEDKYFNQIKKEVVVYIQ